MKRSLFLLLALALAGCGTSYRDRDVALSSMAIFDPERYAGRWYEVAAFPVPFQRGCVNTEARYASRPDGTLSVTNTCRKNGATTRIDGSARITGPGRLSVKLDGVPVAAPYWVLWVDEGYRTAVVGVPSGRAGWILNRTREIPADRLRAAREVLAFNGYDLNRLRATPQGVK
jgi:apolipoprotein D and lipocalin family protein